MVVTSGGTTTGDTISVPTMAFGNQEGIFLTNNGTTNVSSNITGSGGATFSGGGNLALSGTNSYTNTNAVQSLTITGATSGGFTLSFGGAVTTLIPYNATAARFQAAAQGVAEHRFRQRAGHGDQPRSVHHYVHRRPDRDAAALQLTVASNLLETGAAHGARSRPP